MRDSTSGMSSENLLASVTSVLIGIDMKFRITFWNGAAEKLFKVSAKEIIGKPFLNPKLRWDKNKLNKEIPRWLSIDIPIRSSEIQYLGMNGARGNIVFTVNPVAGKDGKRLGFFLVGDDITELKHKEVLLELEERFYVISSCALDALIMMDAMGNITYWNSAAKKMFGYSFKDIARKNGCEILISPRHREAYDKGFQVFKKATHNYVVGKIIELIATHKNGSEFPVEISMSAMKIRKRWRVVATIRNITERKQMEIQLRYAQKMESIGQLAAGIAHEINTPIQYVGDNTRFFKDSFSDICKLLEEYGQILNATKQGSSNSDLIDKIEEVIEETDLEYLLDEIPQAIQQSLEGVERVADIVRAMREFSHPGTEEKVPFDLNRAIQNTITVSRNEWKYVADLETYFDPVLPMVSCIPGDFNQVIINLIVNAAHAIADIKDKESKKGKITVSTHRDGDWVQIRIIDTGTGIPERVRERIFDPFFTTKEVGRGTGQGLAICHSIIAKKHGGTITFESEINRGTVFIIRLPVKAGEI